MNARASSSKDRGKKRFGRLEQRLGYEFTDYAHIEQALTHASARKRSEEDFHYERLEFLGDALVGAIVAQALYLRWSKAAEGDLTRARAELVRESSLATTYSIFMCAPLLVAAMSVPLPARVTVPPSLTV